MKNDFNTIKHMAAISSYSEIEKLILKNKKAIIKEYSFLFCTEEEIEKFLDDYFPVIVKDYIDSFGDDKFVNFYKKKIFSYINEYIGCNIENDKEFKMLNRYIEQKILYQEKYSKKQSLEELEKIAILYRRINKIPQLATYQYLLSYNEKIISLVKSILDLTNNSSDNLKYYQVYESSENQIITNFLEIYCMIAKINIDCDLDFEKASNNFSKKGDNKFDIDIMPNDSVRLYLKEISAIPLLTPLEEIELFKSYQNGNYESRNAIIEANLRLVVAVSKRMYRGNVEFLDLIQYGNLGLFKAVDRYNIDSGFKFSTYATWWIRQSINRNLSDNCCYSLVRLPVYIVEKIYKYKAAKKQLSCSLGHEPTNLEIAKKLNWSEAQVEDIIKSSMEVASLNVNSNNDDGRELQDFIPSSDNIEDAVIATTFQQDLRNSIYKILDSMNFTEKEKEVITLRYGLEDGNPMTLEKISKIFNLSRERIRQMESKVINKIRASARVRELAYYMDNPQETLERIEEHRTIVRESGIRYSKEFMANSSSEKDSSPKKNSTIILASVTKKEFSVKPEPEPKNIHVTISQELTRSNKIFERPAANILSVHEKELFLKNHYGFGDGENENTCQVTKKRKVLFCVSSQKEKLIKDVSKKADISINEQGIIESGKVSFMENKVDDKNNSKAKKISEKGEIKMKHGIGIRERYSIIDSTILEEIINSLSEDEQLIIQKRENGRLDAMETKKYCTVIIPKFKRKVLKKVKEGILPVDVLEKCDISVKTKDNTNYQKKKEVKETETVPPFVSIKNSDSKDQLKKSDYADLLVFLKSPIFEKMTSLMPLQDAVIVALRYGQGNLKAHSSSSIASFLEISEEDVVDISKRGLLRFKSGINELIDNAIENEKVKTKK